ncbi:MULTISPECIES: SDR family oxidoreductase [Rhizobium/Agrobacterium group]|uniref:SDR family oxidoreductase n=1 Tax=Rhizobium/Agrobacterium group TaxID=227290 RepID=UPI0028691165|nr:SDR family oxidoreductase [Rhizobium rhizogenes]
MRKPLALSRDVPLARPAHPDEVATVIAFLCSSNAFVVTGATLTVDGGSHCRRSHPRLRLVGPNRTGWVRRWRSTLPGRRRS